MLDVTVLKASFTEEPTMGIKLLIANFAVLIDIESALWDRTFFVDNTNKKIDIIKTVTPVKAFFNDLEIPEKSSWPPKAFITAKQIQISIIGSINATKNSSIKAINKSIEVLETALLEMLPLIMYIVVMIGTKASITLQRAVMYSETNSVRLLQTLRIVKHVHKAEVRENELLIKSDDKESLNILKIEAINKTISMEKKLFIVEFNPKNK